jgi:hypothetical protein
MRVVRYTVCTVQYIEYPKLCWLCDTINHRWASITLKYQSVAFIVPNFRYEPVRYLYHSLPPLFYIFL